ncbi:molybdenum cofactor biosynthesis protein F-domain-containing protein [Rhexocercosporidium sp. MPI-PUGE-AT-0058]|nr:molybdenum cofactor biosynthesis protein F-domain-containing protein [Rhexocercosporidium sp. MPI-PUGE-AT-0058]
MASNSTQPSGYLPQEQWPTLAAMAEGFDEHLMPPSTKLESKVDWAVLEGEEAGSSGEAVYKAYEVREGIFMVDFYKEAHKQVVTLLLDTTTGHLKACISGFVDKGSGDRPVDTFQLTDELVGKHCLYRYTPRDAYQHFYVSTGTLMWHCLAGTEKDVSDSDRCKMFKLSERLYLLYWTETVMPVESIVVIDLQAMRSTGRFLCWDPKPQSAVHIRFGSQATLLNDVDVAAELAKPLRS